METEGVTVTILDWDQEGDVAVDTDEATNQIALLSLESSLALEERKKTQEQPRNHNIEKRRQWYSAMCLAGREHSPMDKKN